ncbi:MAG TPA: hypothetical protein ENJ35_08190 [Gammaproteobacteria bacterium]|nr:hypothetical protein [Gammaproteobacteria bacterium]
MNFRILFSTVLMSFVMTGCLSDNNGPEKQGPGITPPGGDVQPRAAGKLVKADEDMLTAYFRKTLASTANGSNSRGEDLGGAILAPVADGVESAAAGAANKVSTTNLQEVGVDEADLLKTASDGKTIYSLYPDSDRYYAKPLPADVGLPVPERKFEEGIRIMSVRDDGSLKEIKRLSVEAGDQRQKALYLAEKQKKLIAIGESGGNVYAYWFAPYRFSQQKTQLRFIDVQDPASAAVKHKLELDGALVSSRRVGDVLYLVLRHYPDFPYLVDAPLAGDQTKTGTEEKIASLTAADVLPKYSVDGVSKGEMVKPDACYLNQGAATQTADVISIVAVNLDTELPVIKTRCYVGSSEAVYASPQALYLASTRYNYDYSASKIAYSSGMTTDIHKFAFKGMDVEYRGSAEVKGHLGWDQDRKSFRFSESATGDLRVITYNEQRQAFVRPVDIAVDPVDGGDSTAVGGSNSISSSSNSGKSAETESPVLLTILRESKTREALDVVATLPNAAHPESLGRPGEQLYGSRYVGDRAYLITFRVTDPLYVLDLSDPANPYKVGELKISGYSDYLHPINENLLLGIGKEAVPAKSSGPGDFGGAWYQGVKLSLVDVSDPANPREVAKAEIGKRGTQSTALRDHHGVTTLQVGNQLRLAIPVELHDIRGQYGDSSAPNFYYDYTNTGLYRFNIDIDSQTIDATPKPLIVEAREDNGNYYGSDISNDRSVMVGDYVHYLHGGRFWSQNWSNNVVTGPE